MSRTLSKRLAAIEAEHRPEDNKKMVTCLPVSDWAKAEGEEVAPGVWYQTDLHYGRPAIHYSDADSLREWLAKRPDLHGPIYEVITPQEFDEIRANLEAQC
ncbi:hypothetical protein GBK02_15385 [Dechloromonas sp. TW-R-39-2]|uniref:hypothetical protein n=1 Tax=Dechloromonas sp. TW-R-39-2 TaxID=2654218 RepID=UPI00193DEC20|nr:hypothetical protein [Dechloromonas sp. TW-R-39-2]QRM20664.1 hypothetical protein GBK02_15385 [Dechloromonas sp. TW-R-39-2]